MILLVCMTRPKNKILDLALTQKFSKKAQLGSTFTDNKMIDKINNIKRQYLENILIAKNTQMVSKKDQFNP